MSRSFVTVSFGGLRRAVALVELPVARRRCPGAPGRWRGWITIDCAFWSAAGSFSRAMRHGPALGGLVGLEHACRALWAASRARARRGLRLAGRSRASQAGPSRSTTSWSGSSREPNSGRGPSTNAARSSRQLRPSRSSRSRPPSPLGVDRPRAGQLDEPRPSGVGLAGAVDRSAAAVSPRRRGRRRPGRARSGRRRSRSRSPASGDRSRSISSQELRPRRAVRAAPAGPAVEPIAQGVDDLVVEAEVEPALGILVARTDS